MEEGDEDGRSKRSAAQMDCTAGSNESRCCRYPMMIDFDEFDYDFVIAPRRYNAYVCYGQCTRNYLQQYPHTHLAREQKEANKKELQGGGGGGDGSGPCCHPTEYGSLRLVFMNAQQEVIVADLPGMVATKCGCA